MNYLMNFSKSFRSIMSIIRRMCITLRDNRTLPHIPGLDTQRSGSVPFFKENFHNKVAFL